MNARDNAMRHDRERGFSLVEVVIALGMLASVAISISGLFILAGKQVKSGRTSSEALMVGRGILEEMNNWGFAQTYQLFGLDGANNAYTVDTRTSTAARVAPWRNTLTSKLGSGAYATIQVMSLSQTGTPPALNAATCRSIRVLVTVNWNQGTRNRSVMVGTVRM